MRGRLSPSRMSNTAVLRPSFEQDERPSLLRNSLDQSGRSMSNDTIVATTNGSGSDSNSNSSSKESGPISQLQESDKSTMIGTPTSFAKASPFGDDNDIDRHPPKKNNDTKATKLIENGIDSDEKMAVVDVVEASNSIALMGSIRRPTPKKDYHKHEEQNIKQQRHKNAVFVDVQNERTSSNTVSSPEEIFQIKKSILLTLGRCLLEYGSPCHRVEDTLRHTAKMLTIDATFSIIPDLVLVSMTKPNNIDDQQYRPQKYEPETMVIKSAQSFDTGKLVRVTKTMNALHKGDLELEECLASMREIMEAPPTCGPFAICFSFAAIGFSASLCMFEGSWYDAMLASALGLVVALLFLISMKFPVYGPVFEISACILVGIFDRVLHNYVCFTKVAVSSILILLPGYGMTMAVMEISAHQVTTGAIRLIYAVIYAFMLAYGLQIGSSVYLAINPDVPDEGTCGGSISPWFYILLFPIMSISIGLAYGSSRHQWATQIACAGIGFCVLYFLGKIISDEQILSTIAAFAMGLYANFALKLTGDPPLAPLCVGITLLVPGSIGVRDAFALLHQNDLGQGLYPIHMLRISLGISVGLYGSAMIVYPTGKLRSLYISL